MKKLLLIVAALLCVSAASAQTIKKGTIVLSPSMTNVGVNTFSYGPKEATSSEKATRFGFQATGGYALINDLVLTATAGYNSLKAGDGDSSLSVFDIAAGARYYFVPNLFAGASVMYVGGSLGGDTKISSVNLDVQAGYDIFVSNNIAFEPSISYDFGLSSKLGDMPCKFGGLNINLGVLFLLK